MGFNLLSISESSYKTRLVLLCCHIVRFSGFHTSRSAVRGYDLCMCTL